MNTEDEINAVDNSNAHRFTGELFRAITGKDVVWGEPDFVKFADELKANLKAKEERSLTQSEYDAS